MTNGKQTKGAEAPTPISVPQPGQRPLTPEQQAQIQAQQRARTEVAVLKQRFAEVDVAKTIAEAERDQVIQQLRVAQQTIEALTALAKETKKPGKSKHKPEAKPAEDEAEES